MKRKRTGFRVAIAGFLYLCQAVLLAFMAHRLYDSPHYRGVEASPGVWEQQLVPDDGWMIFAGAACIFFILAVISFSLARSGKGTISETV